ncbi:MAG: hypothetical protein B9S32_03680 [Verrucomicrobia bacterium Tous-C9LFEB]|nr:MAG: hypothetical protein B9S32_03680 [Verrucomicrobia bacterium Tous-C9LFEB]
MRYIQAPPELFHKVTQLTPDPLQLRSRHIRKLLLETASATLFLSLQNHSEPVYDLIGLTLGACHET